MNFDVITLCCIECESHIDANRYNKIKNLLEKAEVRITHTDWTEEHLYVDFQADSGVDGLMDAIKEILKPEIENHKLDIRLSGTDYVQQEDGGYFFSSKENREDDIIKCKECGIKLTEKQQATGIHWCTPKPKGD